MTGPAEFTNSVRVQQNTLEQAMVTVPSLLAFAYLSKNDRVAGGLGLTWAFSRILFGLGYPDKREAGFLIGFLTSVTLVGGSMYLGAKELLKKQ